MLRPVLPRADDLTLGPGILHPTNSCTISLCCNIRPVDYDS